jgi:hypothetical protein
MIQQVISKPACSESLKVLENLFSDVKEMDPDRYKSIPKDFVEEMTCSYEFQGKIFKI